VASFASIVAAGPARLAFNKASPGKTYFLALLYLVLAGMAGYASPLLWFIQVHTMDQQMV
jgi:hypothetical protein